MSTVQVELENRESLWKTTLPLRFELQGSGGTNRFSVSRQNFATEAVALLKQIEKQTLDGKDAFWLGQRLKILFRSLGYPLTLNFHQDSIPQYVKQSFSFDEGCGVYRFIGEQGKALYIGKAKNIRKRIAEHVSISSKSSRQFRLKCLTQSLQVKKTGGELHALLLESFLIKKEQPLLNRALQKRKMPFHLMLQANAKGYLVPIVYRDSLSREELLFKREEYLDKLYSFSSKQQSKEFLDRLIKNHSLCLSPSSGSPCFLKQIDRCSGACIEKESVEEYNVRATKAFKKGLNVSDSFVIFENGRHNREFSFTWILKGEHRGSGWIPRNLIHRPRWREFVSERVEFVENSNDAKTIISTYMSSTEDYDLKSWR